MSFVAHSAFGRRWADEDGAVHSSCLCHHKSWWVLGFASELTHTLASRARSLPVNKNDKGLSIVCILQLGKQITPGSISPVWQPHFRIWWENVPPHTRAHTETTNRAIVYFTESWQHHWFGSTELYSQHENAVPNQFYFCNTNVKGLMTSSDTETLHFNEALQLGESFTRQQKRVLRT